MKGEKSFKFCKSFYLSILAVSQKMVYNVHQKKDQATGIVKPLMEEADMNLIIESVKSRKRVF